jgi:hypothetical protein
MYVIKFATGYAPLLIQVYATSAFDFNQEKNGWLLSEFGFVQSFYLVLYFPTSSAGDEVACRQSRRRSH